MVTTLVFVHAVACAAPVYRTATYLAGAAPIHVERQTVEVRQPAGGTRRDPAGCVLTWAGYVQPLLDWCAALGSECSGSVSVSP